MDWLNDFAVPLGKAVFILAVIGIPLFFILRGIIIRYHRSGKFFVKYKIFRRTVKEKYIEWLTTAMQNGMSKDKIKMYLYMKGTDPDLVNEMMWLYNQVIKSMKGGFNKNVGQFEESNREAEGSSKLPTF